MRRPLDISTLNVSTETPFTPMTAIPEPSTKVRQRRPGTVMADQAPSGISSEQVEEFRKRLHRGFYNSPAVQTEVARRMLESGDL